MSDQMRIPCVIMRAGTSKGIFIKENDLPKDQALRDKPSSPSSAAPMSARSTVWPVRTR